MRRLLLRRWFPLAVLLAALFLLGNVAAPYYACDGLQEGDPCTWGYSCRANGECRISDDWTDDPGTQINESLICDTSAR